MGLGVVQLCVGGLGFVFQLGKLLIGLVDRLLPMVGVMPDGRFRSDLRLVRGLYACVFLFHFMDFPVDAGGQRIANLADGLVSLKLQLAFAFRNGQLVLKIKAGFPLAGVLIEDTLFPENLVGGQLFSGSIQTLMRLPGLLLKPLDFSVQTGNVSILRSIRSNSGRISKDCTAIRFLYGGSSPDSLTDRHRRKTGSGCRGWGHTAFGNRCRSSGRSLFLLLLKTPCHRLMQLCCPIRTVRKLGLHRDFLRLYQLRLLKALGDPFRTAFCQIFFHRAFSGHPCDHLVLGFQMLMFHQISPPIRR